MGKYHIFQEITEFAPKILKMGEIYTDSEMCWLEALTTVRSHQELDCYLGQTNLIFCVMDPAGVNYFQKGKNKTKMGGASKWVGLWLFPLHQQ